jgi:spermidine synthase
VATPWKTLDRVETPDGPLELRQRGEDDFLITIGGRVLMNSRANRSELALAELGCAPLAERPAPRVLIGGLGMGCTLRAALDVLPADARVCVCEINPVIVEWCRGPLGAVHGQALDDPRTEIEAADVARSIERRAAEQSGALDAILLDLYEGPHAATDPRSDPFYGSRALSHAARALAPGGLLAVWSEDPDAAFAKRLAAAGFSCEQHRPGRGGRRHVVYVARRR